MATVQPCSPDLHSGPSGAGAEPPVHPSPRRPQPLPHPGRTYTDPEAEVLPWTGLSLVVALAGLFLLIAFPGNERVAASAELLDRDQELELVTALAELRRAVVAFRSEQGAWPGADHATLQGSTALGSEDPWQNWYDRHLAVHAQATAPSPLVVSSLEPLADYLPEGTVPVNVVNGLQSVRLLLAGESMPSEADGCSGWIFDPRNGDLRANSTGRMRSSGRSLFEL